MSAWLEARTHFELMLLGMVGNIISVSLGVMLAKWLVTRKRRPEDPDYANWK